MDTELQLPSVVRREKLLNLIVYFVENTVKCQKLKLFKLLYWADFEHFRQTGKSITGLTYFAWKLGPVPTKLFEELDHPKPDLDHYVYLKPIPQDDPSELGKGLKISSKVDFNGRYFSAREIKIIQDTAFMFRDATGEEMTAITHDPKGPWKQTWDLSKQGEISYRLSLDGRPGSISAIRADRVAANQEMAELLSR